MLPPVRGVRTAQMSFAAAPASYEASADSPGSRSCSSADDCCRTRWRSARASRAAGRGTRRGRRPPRAGSSAAWRTTAPPRRRSPPRQRSTPAGAGSASPLGASCSSPSSPRSTRPTAVAPPAPSPRPSASSGAAPRWPADGRTAVPPWWRSSVWSAWSLVLQPQISHSVRRTQTDLFIYLFIKNIESARMKNEFCSDFCIPKRTN